MKTLISILALFYSLSACGQSDKSLLKFDGYYETDCYTEKGDDEGSQDYLRFYSNGKVINVGTDCEGTTSELKSWFNINAEQVGKGEFEMKGKRIYFSTKSKTGIIKYKGRIKKDGEIQLKWSLINGSRGHDSYKFIAVTGLT
jgi:major membrane immunogen (membrane-anchored lipoprotein)